MKQNKIAGEVSRMINSRNCVKVSDAFGQVLFDIRIAGKAHKLGARLKFRVRDLKSSLQKREVL